MNLSRLASAKLGIPVLTGALLALLVTTASSPSFARGPDAKPQGGLDGGGGDGTPFEEPEAAPDDGKDGGDGPPGRPSKLDHQDVHVDRSGSFMSKMLQILNLWLLR